MTRPPTKPFAFTLILTAFNAVGVIVGSILFLRIRTKMLTIHQDLFPDQPLPTLTKAVLEIPSWIVILLAALLMLLLILKERLRHHRRGLALLLNLLFIALAATAVMSFVLLIVAPYIAALKMNLATTLINP